MTAAFGIRAYATTSFIFDSRHPRPNFILPYERFPPGPALEKEDSRIYGVLFTQKGERIWKFFLFASFSRPAYRSIMARRERDGYS